MEHGVYLSIKPFLQDCLSTMNGLELFSEGESIVGDARTSFYFYKGEKKCLKQYYCLQLCK